MRGFSFLIVLVFIALLVPLFGLENSLVKYAGDLNLAFIENQEYINTYSDIQRTFSEIARECKPGEDCSYLLSEWVKYWESKGFLVETGRIDYKKPGIEEHANPILQSTSGKVILGPDRKVNNFGIILSKEDGNRTLVFILPGGVWHHE